MAVLVDAQTKVLCQGFTGAQAESLAEAHRVLRSLAAEPDTAVVDLELPISDGVELIREIHETWPHVPILALTTSGDPERDARAKEAGADEVLTMAASAEKLL
jgi:DNA-binding response OmpR family regulator